MTNLSRILSFLTIASGILSVIASAPLDAVADELDIWIGTAGDEGVFHLRLNTDKAGRQLSKPTKLNTLGGAGFLAMHSQGHTLYATASKNKVGGIASYSIDQSGAMPILVETGFVETGDGNAACVAVDQTARVAMSAQYGGGSICTYLVDPSGAIKSLVKRTEQGPGSGMVGNRQDSAHPHWVGMSPDNRFLCVPDLGMDAVVVYQLDSETGETKQSQVVPCPSGGGPRHMKFHPNGNFAYVLNELKLTLSAFRYHVESGKFDPLQEIETLPAELKDKHLNSAAEVRIHPSGRFLYASNRGHDSITVFHLDPESGMLTFVERESVRGSWPRNFNVDPTGKWLVAAGRKSNTLALFEIDQKTGALTFTRSIVNVPNPICVEFGGMKN